MCHEASKHGHLIFCELQLPSSGGGLGVLAEVYSTLCAVVLAKDIRRVLHAEWWVQDIACPPVVLFLNVLLDEV